MNEQQLPKEALLLKLLNMTTAEDNVALVAIRKANELLSSSGWTWEKLLAGKITIVEDPFNKVFDIQKQHEADKAATPPAPGWATPSAPPRPARKSPPPQGYAPNVPPAQPTPPPPQFRSGAVNQPELGDRPNRYAGHCYCCGTEVDNQAGFIFKPSTFNPSAKDKWEIACAPCNKNVKTIQPTRAKKRFAAHQANSHVDLSNL